MTRFACPICKTVLQAPDRKVGKKAACPKCGQSIIIPSPLAPIPMVEPADQPRNIWVAALPVVAFALSTAVFLVAVLSGMNHEADRMAGRTISQGHAPDLVSLVIAAALYLLVAATIGSVIASICLWKQHAMSGKVFTVLAGTLLAPYWLCGAVVGGYGYRHSLEHHTSKPAFCCTSRHTHAILS